MAMLVSRCLLLVLLPLPAVAPLPPVFMDYPVVRLPAGSYKGERLTASGGRGTAYLRLRGVPYAEQPLGALRWQPPRPLAPMPEGKVADATAFGPDCVNAPWTTRITSIHFASMDEACLFLNIWAAEQYVEKRPVMLWIHGGSFTSGGSSMYPGDGLLALRDDVILVTVNYRLSAFGFLGGAAVARASQDSSAGNFGLQDTRQALRWVQANIGALGGDASRVTIFGESAGASLVAVHLTAPRSAGLFSKAIMQSGAFDNYTVQKTPEANFATFASAAGCSVTKAGADAALACLRRRPLRSLFGDEASLLPALAAASAAGWPMPVVDGVELAAPPEVLAARGEVNQVAGVLLGTNLNEGRLLMPLQMPVPGAPATSRLEFIEWLRSQFSPAIVEEVLIRYPAWDYGDSYWSAAARVFTDSQYLCPTRRSAQWLLQSGRVPPESVYVYQLRYEPSIYSVYGKLVYWWEWCHTLWFCANSSVPIGVGHAADVLLLFPYKKILNQTDSAMSLQMVNWWSRFAVSANPNADEPLNSTAQWLPFAARNETLLLQPEPKLAFGLRGDICDFWDAEHPVPYSALAAGTARAARAASAVRPVAVRQNLFEEVLV